MLKYDISFFSKIMMIFVIVVLITVIYLMIVKHDTVNLFWAIPSLIFVIVVELGVWPASIIIDDEKIEQRFPPHPFYKTKSMFWGDVDYVVKDGLDEFPMCRLVSNSSGKNRMINIAGVKNMKAMIVEIVKRAKNAEIAPAFRELAEKGLEE